MKLFQIRRSEDRGKADIGWLKSYHTFSFSTYRDPEHMHFRELRVINEDRVEGGQGFLPHSHQDMEIITYILNGALEHKDSMGNTSVIRNGEVQVMSAGTGVTHSEFNHSTDEIVHLLQIWIFPNENGLNPSYQQKKFADEDRLNQLKTIVSPDGRDGSLLIHQDASLSLGLYEEGKELSYTPSKDRYSWIQITRGKFGIQNKSTDVLQQGDGLAIDSSSAIRLKALNQQSELLLFDLA